MHRGVSWRASGRYRHRERCVVIPSVGAPLVIPSVAPKARSRGTAEIGRVPPIDSRAPFRFVVAVTDPDWFSFLSARPEIEEVNFWRPGATTTLYQRGTPWFYLLRGTDQIVGGAFFSAYDRMPVGLAWETFQIANGAPTFDDFLRILASIKRVRPAQVGEIGCVALSQPFYFATSERIKAHRLYGPLKSFDTADSDGRALWRELQPRMIEAARVTSASYSPPPQAPLRGSFTLVETRPGQATFRIDVEKAYAYRCAITGERTRPALEAAHIVPWREARQHDVRNGLLLRSDIHNLFDAGYVTVDPDLRFVVSSAIREEFENGRDYYALQGREIRVPVHDNQRPLNENLEWHRSNRFKG